jgi:hypothetical protein
MNNILAIKEKKSFIIEVGGSENTEELVKSGRYDFVDGYIVNKDLNFFPNRNHGQQKMKKEVVLLRFIFGDSRYFEYFGLDQAIALAEKHGLARPDYEDAFYFGAQNPEFIRELESWPCAVVFLHEPWQYPDYGSSIIKIDKGAVGRHNPPSLNFDFLKKGWVTHTDWLAFVKK